MKRIITVLALICALLGALPVRALTPAQVLEKSASALLKSGGIKAAYTVSSGGGKQSGSITAKGKKFHISAGGLQSWYDGSTLWNYDRSAGEVTLSTPTAAELASVSPYALVASYKTAYTPSALTSKIPGTYAIRLTPRSKQNPLKGAVVYIRTTDLLPCRLDVTARDGAATTIIITSIKTGQAVGDAAFRFPKTKYPGVQIIDLR